MTDKLSEPCGECGMLCEPNEYHPFAACLMFKACHDSDTVRANLSTPALRALTQRAELAERRLEEENDARDHAIAFQAELKGEIVDLKQRLREALAEPTEGELGVIRVETVKDKGCGCAGCYAIRVISARRARLMGEDK